MKTIVKDWVAKAEGDFNAAKICFRARPVSFNCHSCFHAYECADKYIKAVLAAHDVRFRFTLPLDRAFARLEQQCLGWRNLRERIRLLNRFDESILYPGRRASRMDARSALATCRLIRKKAHESLGLKSKGPRRSIPAKATRVRENNNRMRIRP